MAEHAPKEDHAVEEAGVPTPADENFGTDHPVVPASTEEPEREASRSAGASLEDPMEDGSAVDASRDTPPAEHAPTREFLDVLPIGERVRRRRSSSKLMFDRMDAPRTWSASEIALDPNDVTLNMDRESPPSDGRKRKSSVSSSEDQTSSAGDSTSRQEARESSGTPRERRPFGKRLAMGAACENCHRSKKRCDGKKPCLNCARKNRTCSFTDPNGMSKIRSRDITPRLEQAEVMIRHLITGTDRHGGGGRPESHAHAHLTVPSVSGGSSPRVPVAEGDPYYHQYSFSYGSATTTPNSHQIDGYHSPSQYYPSQGDHDYQYYQDGWGVPRQSHRRPSNGYHSQQYGSSAPSSHSAVNAPSSHSSILPKPEQKMSSNSSAQWMQTPYNVSTSRLLSLSHEPLLQSTAPSSALKLPLPAALSEPRMNGFAGDARTVPNRFPLTQPSPNESERRPSREPSISGTDATTAEPSGEAPRTDLGIMEYLNRDGKANATSPKFRPSLPSVHVPPVESGSAPTWSSTSDRVARIAPLAPKIQLAGTPFEGNAKWVWLCWIQLEVLIKTASRSSVLLYVPAVHTWVASVPV
ncbi:hypothetical protein M427DRAFT_47840 [Gonapodya prolifera JEL478]|uniref:Zn(2)-C6 fungal-type domain-containing protein n=1 Tax=Gonapodya prolifera (strain JEL478) TaxID=1344416 RepID=A0A139A1P6_GONPJ|nr:hypothetical protein M427DRAFT_47840 [Gonapodya prolifera JEL478]|eukprot:KXS10707.1 hypothetical protein M427DRAFT_47840 [Gonapodya prolifera JEL478]